MKNVLSIFAFTLALAILTNPSSAGDVPKEKQVVKTSTNSSSLLVSAQVLPTANVTVAQSTDNKGNMFIDGNVRGWPTVIVSSSSGDYAASPTVTPSGIMFNTTDFTKDATDGKPLIITVLY